MASSQIAHNIGEQFRTGDIAIQENVEFSGMLLSPAVLLGLKEAGFERPSPIQLKAIPLGRCGLDLIVQAKSGTGKTCVFSVIALEGLQMDSNSVQVLVLAPTREIAVQIWEVMTSLGCHIEGLKCHMFIGGLPVHEDKLKLKNCHIAIGSPGRIKQLIELGAINTDTVRLFVLDEADKLLESNFQEQINWIYSTLPENKQMLALSATYPESLAQHLTKYSRNPTFVRLNSSDPALLGIKQFFQVTPYHPMQHVVFEEKVKYLLKLLTSATFNQCLVFSNYQTRAENLCDILNSQGWPATFISGSQEQHLRLEAMAKLKGFQCRVLVSTDLTSRGIDADKVNLVVNMDLPRDHETYLHRIGRAGRFGTYGAAVTYASKGNELEQLQAIERKCNTSIRQLPDPIPNDLVKSLGYVDISHLVTAEPLNEHADLAAILNEHSTDNKTTEANAKTFEIMSGIQDKMDESSACSNGHDQEISNDFVNIVKNGLHSTELNETMSEHLCNGQPNTNTVSDNSVNQKKHLSLGLRCLSNFPKELKIPGQDANENIESPNGNAKIEDLTTVTFQKGQRAVNDRLKQNECPVTVTKQTYETKPEKYQHPYGKWTVVEKPKQDEQSKFNEVNDVKNDKTEDEIPPRPDTEINGDISHISLRTSCHSSAASVTEGKRKPGICLNTQCSTTSDIKAPFLIPPLYKQNKTKLRFATFNGALENYNSFMEYSFDEPGEADNNGTEMSKQVDEEKSECMVDEQLINDVSVYLENISIERTRSHQIDLLNKHHSNALVEQTLTSVVSESNKDAVHNKVTQSSIQNTCIGKPLNDSYKGKVYKDEAIQTEVANIEKQESEEAYTESESDYTSGSDSYSSDASDESGSESDDSGSESDNHTENDYTDSHSSDTAPIQGDVYSSAQYFNPMINNPSSYYGNLWQPSSWQPNYYNFGWYPWQQPNVSYPYQYLQSDWERQVELTYKAQLDYLKAMSKLQ